MAKKIDRYFNVRGMQRDASLATFNRESQQKGQFVFEALNIRLTPQKENTGWSFVNEQGPLCVNGSLRGRPLGACVARDKWIIFTDELTGISTETYTNHIYVFSSSNNSVTSLYDGDLNMRYGESNVQTEFCYENEDLLKVYWVDGINQCRVINIAADANTRTKWTTLPNPFDFVPILNLNETVYIEKEYNASGLFEPGVVLYFLTYVDNYHRESKIFYQSPLFYTSMHNRAGMFSTEGDGTLDSQCNNAFKFTIENYDTTFDAIRIYSILRTSLDGEPQAKMVTQLTIADFEETIYFTDTNTTGRSITPTDIFFLGGTPVAAHTINLKDNTLFVGDLDYSNFAQSKSFIKEQQLTLRNILLLEGNTLGFNGNKLLKTLWTEQHLDYHTLLDYSSYLYKIFKYKESYRLGLQLQDLYGQWSDVIYVNDLINNTRLTTPFRNIEQQYVLTDGDIEWKVPCLHLDVTDSESDAAVWIQTLKQVGYKRIRPVIVYPDFSDRETVFQGLVTPTVYSLKSRINNIPYALASWFFRPNPGFKYYPTFVKTDNSVFDEYTGYLLLEMSYNVSNPTLWTKTNIADHLIGTKVNVKLVNENITFVGEIRERATGYPGVSGPTKVNKRLLSTLEDPNHSYTYNYLRLVIYTNIKITPALPFNNDTEKKSGTAKITLINGSTFILNIADPQQDLSFVVSYAYAQKVGAYEQTSTTPYSKTGYYDADTETVSKDLYNHGAFLEYRHNRGIPGVVGYIEDISASPSDLYNVNKNLANGNTLKLGYYSQNKFGAEIGNISVSFKDTWNAYRFFLKQQSLGLVENKEDFVDKYSNIFFVDRNIVTFHSPELQADESMKTVNTDELYFRIVGYAPLVDSTANLQVLVDSPETTQYVLYKKGKEINWPVNPPGFIAPNKKNDDPFLGAKVLNNAACWWDEICYRGGTDCTDGQGKNGQKLTPTGFVVYPWQGTGSLSNSRLRTNYESKETEHLMLWPGVSGKLKQKMLANTRTSYGTVYLENSWQPENAGNIPIKSDIKLFRSNEVTLTKFKTQLQDVYYYGNINNIVNSNRTEQGIDNNKNNITKLWACSPYLRFVSMLGCPIMISLGDTGDTLNPDYYSILAVAIFADTLKGYKFGYKRGFFTKNIWAYDVVNTITPNVRHSNGDIHPDEDWRDIYYNAFVEMTWADLEGHDKYTGMHELFRNEAVLMKYKSTPHYIVTLGEPAGQYKCESLLPYMKYTLDDLKENDGDISHGSYYHSNTAKDVIFPKAYGNGVKTNYISVDTKCPYGYLWVAELFRKDIENKFGGTSEVALSNNIWLPCGDGINLEYPTEVGDTKYYELLWEEGDTYYQPYEYLKTYPYTTTDPNQIYETVVFWSESHFNLDGRYDINRGNTNNFAIVPGVNFNLFNPVYSQTNNFISATYFASNELDVNKFSNRIAWSRSKIFGELVDEWCNLGVDSYLDLDGDKGDVIALAKFNNELVCLQENATSIINYNEKYLITADNGLPIQLANSLKVLGKTYISESIGCNNIDAVAQADSGVYFVDNLGHSLYGYSGERKLQDVSTILGMKSMYNTTTINRVLYDDITKDVYSLGVFKELYNDLPSSNIERALAFNETTGSFTSFYDYSGLFKLANLQGVSYGITPGANQTKVWKMYAGLYGQFFTGNKGYYLTYIVNPSPIDKIFTNVLFNGTVWQQSNNNVTTNCPFDTIEVWNEYQRGKSNLSTSKTTPTPSTLQKDPTLARKFRVWGVDIPRHNISLNGNVARNRARIRSPWIYLNLAKDDTLGYKMVFDDMNVIYFD